MDDLTDQTGRKEQYESISIRKEKTDQRGKEFHRVRVPLDQKGR